MRLSLDLVGLDDPRKAIHEPEDLQVLILDAHPPAHLQHVPDRHLDLERPSGENVDESTGLVRTSLLTVGDRRFVEVFSPGRRKGEVGRMSDQSDLVAELEDRRTDDVEQRKEVGDGCSCETGERRPGAVPGVLSEPERLHVVLDGDASSSGLEDLLERAESLGLLFGRRGHPSGCRGVRDRRSTDLRRVVDTDLDPLCAFEENLVSVADQAVEGAGCVRVESSKKKGREGD
jgi:hypothetical protein